MESRSGFIGLPSDTASVFQWRPRCEIVAGVPWLSRSNHIPKRQAISIDALFFRSLLSDQSFQGAVRTVLIEI